jgi:hypothetical protein
VDSNGTVYATYASSNSTSLVSGIVAILPDGTKRWIVPLDTVRWHARTLVHFNIALLLTFLFCCDRARVWRSGAVWR